MKIEITDDEGNVKLIKVDTPLDADRMEDLILHDLEGFTTCGCCGHLCDTSIIDMRQYPRGWKVVCESC